MVNIFSKKIKQRLLKRNLIMEKYLKQNSTSSSSGGPDPRIQPRFLYIIYRMLPTLVSCLPFHSYLIVVLLVIPCTF